MNRTRSRIRFEIREQHYFIQDTGIRNLIFIMSE